MTTPPHTSSKHNSARSNPDAPQGAGSSKHESSRIQTHSQVGEGSETELDPLHRLWRARMDAIKAKRPARKQQKVARPPETRQAAQTPVVSGAEKSFPRSLTPGAFRPKAAGSVSRVQQGRVSKKKIATSTQGNAPKLGKSAINSDDHDSANLEEDNDHDQTPRAPVYSRARLESHQGLDTQSASNNAETESSKDTQVSAIIQPQLQYQVLPDQGTQNSGQIPVYPSPMSFADFVEKLFTRPSLTNPELRADQPGVDCDQILPQAMQGSIHGLIQLMQEQRQTCSAMKPQLLEAQVRHLMQPFGNLSDDTLRALMFLAEQVGKGREHVAEYQDLEQRYKQLLDEIREFKNVTTENLLALASPLLRRQT